MLTTMIELPRIDAVPEILGASALINFWVGVKLADAIVRNEKCDCITKQCLQFALAKMSMKRTGNRFLAAKAWVAAGSEGAAQSGSPYGAILCVITSGSIDGGSYRCTVHTN